MAQDLHVGLHLGIGARRAANQEKPAVFEYHDRIHGVAYPLARLEAVYMVRVQVPVGHPVVEQDARVSGDDAGAPRAL